MLFREGGQRRLNQFNTISTKRSVSHKYKYKDEYNTNTMEYKQIVIEERRSEEAKPAHYELASRSADSPLPVGSAISNYLREA